MTTKTFDAVEMKRQGSLAIYHAIATLSVEQQLAFWQQRTEMLLKQQRTLANKQQDEQQGIELASATGARG